MRRPKTPKAKSPKPRRPSPRRRGYDSKWQAFAKAIAATWIREGRPCGWCGRPLRPGQTLDVDHIVTLAQAPERRFDPTNLRVCHHWCHSRRTAQDKQATERGYRLGVGADGLPEDPDHPFNRED